MSELLSVQTAKARLLAAFQPQARETLALARAEGRVLAQAVMAPFDLPPFANSSMDGFAVRAVEVAAVRAAQPVVLPVVGDIPAGATEVPPLPPGGVMRIMTGAPLPAGADAVVPVEDTDVWGRDQNLPAPASVAIRQAAARGANVRPQGQDLRRGELAVAAGTRLRPQEIGFLAMLGAAQVEVWRAARVLILSTGDELVAPGGHLQPGQIFDANGMMLAAQVRRSGGEVAAALVVPDQPAAIAAALARGAAEADVILSSAGVSVGAFDFVRQAVLAAGTLDFWRVNMRPGKPLAFGRFRGVPFIGLPGNPVSAFVGFEVFVRPALRRLMGCEVCERPVVRAILQEPIESDGRETYLRARLTRQNSRFYARLTGHQGSGNLHALVEANSLLVLASGVKSLPVGAECDAWLLDD